MRRLDSFATPARVNVRFFAEGDRATRVEFEHTDLDWLGDGWENVVRGISGDGGWRMILDAFAGAFAG